MGCNNGGERARGGEGFFSALAQRRITARKSRELYDLRGKKKGKSGERWNRDKSAVRATRGACSPSSRSFRLRLFLLIVFLFSLPGDKSIARHILIRGTSIMPLKTDNGTYSVKLLRAISLPPRRKSRSLALSPCPFLRRWSCDPLS